MQLSSEDAARIRESRPPCRAIDARETLPLGMDYEDAENASSMRTDCMYEVATSGAKPGSATVTYY
jgi:hypothetical protein